MIIKTAVTLLHGYAIWVRQLPKATGLMFTARSSAGRTVKIFLFGVGVILPLGSLIWALLFWHGNAVHRAGGAVLPGKVATITPAAGGDA